MFLCAKAWEFDRKLRSFSDSRFYGYFSIVRSSEVFDDCESQTGSAQVA